MWRRFRAGCGAKRFAGGGAGVFVVGGKQVFEATEQFGVERDFFLGVFSSMVNL